MIVVKWLRAFGLFWYDFIVGDDWLLAVGVIVALGVTALIAHVAKAPSWWLLPVVVVAVIVVSTVRAGRKVAARAAAVPSVQPDTSAAEQDASSVVTPPEVETTIPAEQPAAASD